MTAKPDKTAADYMAIAVCPALIMVLVGSLVFFLVQIGYTGEWIHRLQWTLFWFVFAMVLVSRIAIQQSTGAAFLYGLVLAWATSMMLVRYIGFFWGVWLLLALIWWTSNKIVWDCTFIDEDQDASGQGLLQVSRIQKWVLTQQAKVHAVPGTERDDSFEARLSNPKSEIRNPKSVAIPRSAFRTPHSKNPQSKRRPTKKQDVHSPGLWVLYFSFAAVPVFGLGELLLKSDDASGRRVCFILLFAYLASAFGLLLLTSFLGLRRYLRQRFLVMPMAMAGSWVVTGVAIMVGVLATALLLPRPQTPYSLAAFVTKFSSPPEEGSRPSQRQSQGTDGRTQSQTPSDQGQPSPESMPGEDQSGSQPRTSPSESGRASGSAQTAGGIMPSITRPAIHFERWLSYLLVGILLIVAMVRFRPEITAALKALSEWLWPSKAKRQTAGHSTPTPREEGQPPRQFPNPFQTGQAEQMSLAELVRYSYEGLTLWAKARGFALDQSETPLELADRLSVREPVLANEIRLLSSYYSHLAYADKLPDDTSAVVLKRLWSVIGPVWKDR